MLHLGVGADAARRCVSPGSLKRKRDSPASTAAHAPVKKPHQAGDNAPAAKQYRSPDSDEMQASDCGDMLHGVGSASSLASSSATSTVFSSRSAATLAGNTNGHASIASALTPLTAHDDSSPPKRSISPYPTGPRAMQPNGIAAPAMTSNLGSGRVHGHAHTHAHAHAHPHAHTHIHTHTQTPRVTPSDSASAPAARPQMLPPSGKAKGYRVVWDPELDNKLSKEERKRATPRKREFGTETYDPDAPPDPRLAIPGYMSGNCRAKTAPSKGILRVAPYTIAPYRQVDKHSIGPGEAQQVVVTGFDPFLPESTLKLNFSTYGSIASVQSKTDPNTGSFLGIALIKYRDTQEISGALAAKQAEAEFNGQRIGLHPVHVELDREGRKCKRLVEHAVRRAREERAKEAGAHVVPPPPPPPAADSARSAADACAPPLNAPKGPSGGRSAPKIPEGPKAMMAQNMLKPAAMAAVEQESVLSWIKRRPYIHIPSSSVPVLGTTIPHLKKRLKAYNWREVRLDQTGYYVIFDDSKRGEDETERCFVDCNRALLFTYHMEMECQKYGNPNYERSPSPERAKEEMQKREHFERLKREQLEDLEIEKKSRAEDLDPVLGALDQLRIDLRERIMGDIKTRIAMPIFQEGLEPSKHSARRRQLGLPDPSGVENKPPGLLFTKPDDAPPQTLRSRFGQGLARSGPLRPHDRNALRGRKGEPLRGAANAFVDERRRRPAPPKPSHARGLHFRLQQLFDEDEESDDERQTSITRDTEEQESRPLSRASRTSTPFESESVADTPKHKRRKMGEWDEEERETFDAFQKSTLGHLLQKEPEDLATRELELVVGTLPRSSKYATRARTELYIRQRSKADDDLFRVHSDATRADSEAAPVKLETDGTPATEAAIKAVKDKAKKKKTTRKTKKQILEEQESLKAEVKETGLASESPPPQTVSVAERAEHGLDEVEAEAEAEADEEEEEEVFEPKEVHLRFTHDKPRRTVEDDVGLVLDLDGWQETIKDDEDLGFARLALSDEPASDLGDVRLWAWTQKEIKALNTNNLRGPASAGIEGYYVPNLTGSARTEGVGKILNEEKSKYLPHRIKVQRAREERQAQAKANPTAAAEAAKIAAAERIASTATSRSNRVNNRRLVNDINAQKQNLVNNSDADVAIRFNQLKKRKKLVKFDRSAIHGWGLYAEENIGINELIIEYVGEKVRQKVADMREARYDKQGVGSSYLFRMMDDEIVDATKKGGIARFINHSCNPNCTAKIIKVEGTPRIVIYALKDIWKNEELTYDYKFEREIGSTDRIPCLCGSANCKGFLN